MDINELIQMVTDGLPAEDAARVRSAIERDTVKTRVSTLKQEREYQALVDKQAQLQQELDGAPDKSVVGAKAYKEWYDKNFTIAQKNYELLTKYVTKYGADPDNPAAPAQPGSSGPTEADIIRIVNEKVLPNYVPATAVASALSGQMKVIQKHMLAGRKTPIDVDQVQKLAGTKYNGDLEAAYDEWDKPEREKADKASRDSEVDRRVKEELQKRGASAHFPAGADLTPSSLSQRSKKDLEGFDRTSLTRDLAQTWMNGTDDGAAS